MPKVKNAKSEKMYDMKHENIKNDFSILQNKIHGKNICYLDSAASAQKPKYVIDKISHFYQNEYANVHRGAHQLSVAATKAYEDARCKVQQFINAKSQNEIIFTSNATSAINMIASSYGRKFFKRDDEIILSIMEHHSNIVPWHFWRERHGVKIKWVDVDDDGQLIMEQYKNAFSDKTRFVAMTHMSNVLGSVNDVCQIVEYAHSNNVPVLIDGSQAAVHCSIDVQKIGCDFYVFTGHKLYGPTGIGVCYAKEDILEEIGPFMGGGEMVESVTKDKIIYANTPQKFEAGTPQIAQAVGLAAAIEYMQNIGMDNIYQHEKKITQYASEKIANVKGVRIIGQQKNKGPIITFVIDDIHAHDVSTILDNYAIAVRAGLHCAEPLHHRFNIKSSCRASFAIYNDEEDVDRLYKALQKVRGFFT